ncbi:MAG TPA: hypothetical protein VL947_10855 [Cytophagales bacterium]|nr:hypothetical protein [Cytophagales bacterium]
MFNFCSIFISNTGEGSSMETIAIDPYANRSPVVAGIHWPGTTVS